MMINDGYEAQCEGRGENGTKTEFEVPYDAQCEKFKQEPRNLFAFQDTVRRWTKPVQRTVNGTNEGRIQRDNGPLVGTSNSANMNGEESVAFGSYRRKCEYCGI